MMLAHDETEQRYNIKSDESCNSGLQLAGEDVKMNVFENREKRLVTYNYMMMIF